MSRSQEEIELIRKTIQDSIAMAQESLAQMVARQVVEIREDMQGIQEALRKSGARQLQMEADLSDVGRTCEVLKRRLQDIHTDLTDSSPHMREFSVRLDHLEQEVADLRQRLSSVA